MCNKPDSGDTKQKVRVFCDRALPGQPLRFQSMFLEIEYDIDDPEVAEVVELLASLS